MAPYGPHRSQWGAGHRAVTPHLGACDTLRACAHLRLGSRATRLSQSAAISVAAAAGRVSAEVGTLIDRLGRKVAHEIAADLVFETSEWRDINAEERAGCSGISSSQSSLVLYSGNVDNPEEIR